MAWRPHRQLIEGFLDNSVRGRVTGQLQFTGMREEVTLDLVGDFHRDIRGAAIRIFGDSPEEGTDGYMGGFSPLQKGAAGDITAGLEPADYVNYPYIEWYSVENGRVVLELEADKVQIIGAPLPSEQEEPADGRTQLENMERFLISVCESLSTADEK